MKQECAHEWLDKPGFRFGTFWVQRSDCIKCGAIQVTETPMVRNPCGVLVKPGRPEAKNLEQITEEILAETDAEK